MTFRNAAPALWAVVPAAGRGERFHSGLSNTDPARTMAPQRKQYAALLGRPVIEWTLGTLLREARITGVVVALAADDPEWSRAAVGLQGLGEAAPNSAVPRLLTVAGGATRAESVLSALNFLRPRVKDGDWVLVHDAARPCLDADDLGALLDSLASAVDGAILAVPIADTVKRERGGVGADTVDREGLWRALTPQVFRYAPLRAALRSALSGAAGPTDEAQAMEAAGMHAVLVAGSALNIKITRAGDLATAAAILRGSGGTAMRMGQGIDVHSYGAGDHIVLGGVRIEHSQGVVAHSDGDVIIHALCDAILGALGQGDIGVHFPDTDPALRGADSRLFLRHTAKLMADAGYRIENADLTVLAQAPRIAAHRGAMVANLAADLACDPARVNIKATTTERLGFVGREEGLAAMAIVGLVLR